MVQLVVSFPGPFRARQQRNIFYGTTYLATPKSPDFPPILHAKSGGNRQNPPNLGEDGPRPSLEASPALMGSSKAGLFVPKMYDSRRPVWGDKLTAAPPSGCAALSSEAHPKQSFLGIAPGLPMTDIEAELPLLDPQA